MSIIDTLIRGRNKGKKMSESEKNGISVDETLRKINYENKRKKMSSRLREKTSNVVVERNHNYGFDDRNNLNLLRNKNKFDGR